MDFLPITDIAIVAVLFGAAFGYSVWRGTGLLTTALFALPIAALVFTFFPYDAYSIPLISATGTFAEITLFILLFALFMGVLHRATGGIRTGNRTLHSATIAVLFTFVLLSFSYHIVPIQTFYEFGPLIENVFASANNLFWILILALLAVALI